jgi:hypothetical protein
MEKWQAEGQPEAGLLLREKTHELLAGLAAPDDYDDLTRKGSELIELVARKKRKP